MHILSCQPQTVFKKGNIEIDYFDKFHCLHLTWSGEISKEEYKVVMLQMLDFSQKLKAQFWILDAREEDKFKHYDPEWTASVLVREVEKCQIRKIARIESGHFYNETRLSAFMDQLLKEADSTIQFRYLKDANHALGWFVDEMPEE
jgi:hypothetical protein